MLFGSLVYVLVLALGTLLAQDTPGAQNVTNSAIDNAPSGPAASAAPAVSGPPVQVDRSGVTFVFAAAPTNAAVVPQGSNGETNGVNGIGATSGNGQTGQVVSAVNADLLCTPGTLLGQFIVSSIGFFIE